MKEVLTPELSEAILRRALEVNHAAMAGTPTREVIKVTLDLSTARLETKPYEIKFPFRSFFVRSATDSSTEVSLRLGTEDTYQDPIKLKTNDAGALPFPVKQAYLFWSAQSSKTMEIYFFLTGEFRSGSQLSISGGGVAIAEGDSVTPEEAGESDSTAALLFAADANRKVMFIQNHDSIPIFISGTDDVTTDTGANPGIKILPGGAYEWRSTAACYVISSVPGTAAKIGLNRFA